MSAIEETIATRVRERRIALGVGQRAIAGRMQQQGHDWHQTTVSRTEESKRPLRVSELMSLAVALRTDVTTLLGQGELTDIEAKHREVGRSDLMAKLRDSLDAGEIPGTAISWQGEKVWIHTTEQVADWLRSRTEAAGGGS